MFNAKWLINLFVLFFSGKNAKINCSCSCHSISDREMLTSINVFFNNNRLCLPKYKRRPNSFDNTHFWSKNLQGRYTRFLTVPEVADFAPHGMLRSQYWSKMRKTIEEKMANFELQQKVIWSNKIFSFFPSMF